MYNIIALLCITIIYTINIYNNYNNYNYIYIIIIYIYNYYIYYIYIYHVGKSPTFFPTLFDDVRSRPLCNDTVIFIPNVITDDVDASCRRSISLR